MAQRARGVGAARGRTGAAGRPGAGRNGGRRGPAEDMYVTGTDAQPVGRAQLNALRLRLRDLVEPVVVAEGLDLEDIAVSRMGRRYLVRVTVDADGGIGHDELSDVSRAVSRALDEAEDRDGELTPDSYTLELSSPGIDRPLTLPRHWQRNVGRLVAVRAGGRQVTGRVTATDERGVTLEVNGQSVDASFADLGPGRVQVEFTRLAELTDDEFGPEVADDEPEAATHGDDLVFDDSEDES